MLTRAILSEGCKSVAAGMNPMDLRRGINLAVEHVLADLKKRAKMISTTEEIAQVIPHHHYKRSQKYAPPRMHFNTSVRQPQIEGAAIVCLLLCIHAAVTSEPSLQMGMTFRVCMLYICHTDASILLCANMDAVIEHATASSLCCCLPSVWTTTGRHNLCKW